MSDYEYSDSFISDEDDAPELTRVRGTECPKIQASLNVPGQSQISDSVHHVKKLAFNHVLLFGAHRGGRGRGRNVTSRTSVANSEPKTDGVVQRMLSAKNLKLNELRNQIEEMQTAFRDLKEENKLLKKMQHRQEKALVSTRIRRGISPKSSQSIRTRSDH
uniref:Lebercilin-like n=1 Tax=Crassostrea virginica TaxID=6565 RepID=A0A8B8AUT7_CRAVI|nr:lebercilin-like [Crassostrea virginica]